MYMQPSSCYSWIRGALGALGGSNFNARCVRSTWLADLDPGTFALAGMKANRAGLGGPAVAAAVRIALETEFATSKPAADQEPGGDPYYGKCRNLLPIHMFKITV
jgi:hypothetical protein